MSRRPRRNTIQWSGDLPSVDDVYIPGRSVTVTEPTTGAEEWRSWWSDEWAQGTLDVVGRAARSTGYYWGPNAAALREELKEWMVEEAMKLRERYVPPDDDDDPEQVWYRVLFSQLRFHAANFHAAAYNRGDLHRASLDAMLEEAASTGATLPPMKHLTGHGLDVMPPPQYSVLIETMAGDDDPRVGPDKDEDLCLLWGCFEPRTYRGLCHGHYEIERRNALGECSVLECLELAHLKGLCKGHYLKMRKALAAPCLDSECERPQVARGLCGPCGKRYRASGIEPPLAPARRTAKGTTCEVAGCEASTLKRGLCSPHYHANRRANR